MYNKLRSIRRTKNISVSELSKSIGKSTKSYYKRESGKVKFSLSEIQIIANIMQMPIEDIFFDNNLSKIESVAI